MKLYWRTCAGILAWIAAFNVAGAQCVAVDFDLPATLCQEQSLRISPAATYANYEWDFCSGDFENPASAAVFLPSAGSAFNIELVEADGNYFGFYFSRSNQKLFRLDFGADPNSTPTTIDLGSIGGSAMLSIEVVKQGSDYIGFGIDFANKLYRFTFGTSLTNVPFSAEVIYDNDPPGTLDDNLLATPIDMKAVEDETGKYIFIANLNANKITRFFFAADYTVAVASIAIDDFTVTGSAGLGGVSFIRDCSGWYAVSTSIGGGQVTRIEFAGGLADAAPACTIINGGLSFTPTSPAGISLAYENASYYALVQSQTSSSDLYRINFGNAMSNAVVESTNLGNYGVLSDVFGFSAYKVDSRWLIFSSQNAGQNVYKTTFEDKCLGDTRTSLSDINTVQTTSADVFQVSLDVADVNGVKSGIAKSTTVSALLAPDITIGTQNVCAQHDVLLSYTTLAGGVSSVEWDFGDLTSTSTLDNVAHVYATAGEYEIRLDIVASNTCENTAFKNIEVYEPPVADFTVPGGLMCTGNEFTFVNNTVDVFDGLLSYSWDVDAATVSSLRDLEYTFATTADADITLTVSIPGCTDDILKTVTGLQTGPTVGFNVSGQCEDEAVTLANTSTGSIAGYLWDFGNGDTSTSQDESRTFSAIGTYPVTLHTTGTNTCVSTLQQDVVVYTKPLADFSLDAPPLSCSGTPAQFHDATPVPVDSNLQDWTWLFGDGANGTGEDPTHIYVLDGTYSIELTVVTDKGCSGQTTSDVSIAESPSAAFSNTIPCVDELVQFTAGVEPLANAWHWEIDNVNYEIENPVHTFAAAGDYSLLLTVMATNDCASTITTTVSVPVVPSIDILIDNVYALQEASLSAVSSGSADLASDYLWDFGGGQSATGEVATHTFGHAGIYPVQVEITTASGCVYPYSEDLTIEPPQIADFTINTQTCTEQLVDITNTSTDAVSFEWDFCAGELDNTPTASVLLNNASVPFRVEMIEDGGNYYGFFTSRGNQKLYRLDFGSHVNSIPLQVDLGNLGLSVPWLNVEIVKENNDYFGFILDFNKKLYRFSLGTSITNSPFNVEVIYSDGLLANPVDLTVLEDATGKYAFVANSNDANIVRLTFNGSFNSTAADIPATATAIDVGFGANTGLSFINAEGAWYAIASTPGGNLVRLSFVNGLADVAPEASAISGLPFAPSYRGVAVVSDNDQYYIFAQSATAMYRVSLGSSMNNAPQSSSDFGGFTLFSDVFGLSVYKAKSDWLVLSSENSGPNIYRIAFPSDCFSDTEYSTSFEPAVITTAAGSVSVTLTATDEFGNFSTNAATMTVTADMAPAIDFTKQNMCAGHDVVFTSQGAPEIVSYDWSFGDSSPVSADQNPLHQYVAAGTFDVRLDVTADNSCSNFATGQIKIYSSPVALFDLPQIFVCTNNEVVFSNNTIDDFEGNLSFEWFIDNVSSGVTADLQYTFTDTGDHQVKLIASIPGCEDEDIQDLLGVDSGPVVSVTVSGNCESMPVDFVSEAVGDISGYLWDFGDGATSTDANIQHQLLPGVHTVLLHVETTNTCVTTISTPITVYTSPIPDFYLDLPPFSCSGSASQFHDTTPGPDDSNLQTWTWVLGDGATANIQDPTHVYTLSGDYTVELTVATDKGCSGQVVKDIVISESPAVDFILSTPCVNTPVQFTASPEPTVDTWAWRIGSVTSQSQNPIHTFVSPGDYPTELIVTATNNCSSALTNTVHVPDVPTIDISIISACVGTAATLSASSSGSDDPTVNYSWDLGGGGATHEGETIVHTFAQVASYPVDVETTTASGCVYEYSEDVLIHPVPIAVFTPLDEYGPAPLTVNFMNSSIGATSYEWLFADQGGTITSTDASPTYTFSQLGNYQVILHSISDDGCTGIADGIVHVIVPHADLAVEGLALFIDPGTNLTKGILQIRNNGNYPISAVDLTIDMGSGVVITDRVEADIDPDQLVSMATSSALSVQSGSVGFVCVTAIIANDENINDNTECLTIGESSKLFESYPNPSDGHLSIQLVGTANEELLIEIANGTGADAYSKTVDVHTGLNVLELDLTTLSPGIYVLRLSTPSSGLTTQRIAIQP